jgi:hypothetical protein
VTLKLFSRLRLKIQQFTNRHRLAVRTGQQIAGSEFILAEVALQFERDNAHDGFASAYRSLFTFMWLDDNRFVQDTHRFDHQQSHIRHDVIRQRLIVNIVVLNIQPKCLPL